MNEKTQKKPSKEIKFFFYKKNGRVKERSEKGRQDYLENIERKRIETKILQKRTTLCFCQTVRMKGKTFSKEGSKPLEKFF